MMGGIGTERLDQDIDIREHHGVFMTSSRSADRFRSTPGRTPPVALETGRLTRFLRISFDWDKRRVSPSSIKEVRVRPSLFARFLARLRRSSFIRTVVLIHIDMPDWHQYVKQETPIPKMGFIERIILPKHYFVLGRKKHPQFGKKDVS
jgi:hypothetical protein